MLVAEVCLLMYDLTDGKAALWSPWILGCRIPGVWHTSLIIFGLEYFYGGQIERMKHSDVVEYLNMTPNKSLVLGYTRRTPFEFHHFLRRIEGAFISETYDLLQWNCNHFTDVCARFLLNGQGIPQQILHLPDKVKATVVGRLIIRVLQVLQESNPIEAYMNE